MLSLFLFFFLSLSLPLFLSLSLSLYLLPFTLTLFNTVDLNWINNFTMFLSPTPFFLYFYFLLSLIICSLSFFLCSIFPLSPLYITLSSSVSPSFSPFSWNYLYSLHSISLTTSLFFHFFSIFLLYFVPFLFLRSPFFLHLSHPSISFLVFSLKLAFPSFC